MAANPTTGNVGGGMGAGGGNVKTPKTKPLTAEQLLAGLVGGTLSVSDLSRQQLDTIAAIRLGRLDYNAKDLKALGLTMDNISKGAFLELKTDLRSIIKDDKVTRGELNGFAKLVTKTLKNETIKQLEEDAAELVPGTEFGLARAGVRNASQAQFARLGTSLARGARGNIRTSALGDRAYGAGGLGRVAVMGVG